MAAVLEDIQDELTSLLSLLWWKVDTATYTAWLATKQNVLWFTPENVVNKSTNTALWTSNSLYPSQNAVKTYVDNNLWTWSIAWEYVIYSDPSPVVDQYSDSGRSFSRFSIL